MVFDSVPWAWLGFFDAGNLMSMLKHVEDPKSVLLQAWRLLADSGVVLDPQTNFADLVVRVQMQDHSRHSQSLSLNQAGFPCDVVKGDRFESGLTFTALRFTRPSVQTDYDIEDRGSVADFWRQHRRDIRRFRAGTQEECLRFSMVESTTPSC